MAKAKNPGNVQGGIKGDETRRNDGAKGGRAAAKAEVAELMRQMAELVEHYSINDIRWFLDEFKKNHYRNPGG